ncbi:MAG: GNAT family N-acetyltransferase [Thermotogota bacterium]
MGYRVERPTYKDKKGIIELCSQIWDGNDYIPSLLDRWLNITDPFLIVRDTQNDKICAIDHATIFNDVAYGEGLRVHVDYRGKGLAKLITKEIMREVLKRGVKTYMALIFSQTKDSIHLSKKAFFEEINGFYLLEKAVKTDSKTVSLKKDINIRPIFPEEISRSKKDFNQLLFATGQAIVDAWTFYPSTEYLAEKYLYECDEGKLIAGLHEHEHELFSICLYTQPGEWLEKIWPHLQEAAAHYGCKVISVAVPFSKKNWVQSFLNVGFTNLWDNDELSLEESTAQLYSLNWANMDQVVLPKQMEKRNLPSNYYRCVTRCPYGFSQVIESFPLKDGEPFPTTYYLVCPHLKYHLSKLEEAGTITKLDGLKNTKAYQEVDAFYAKERRDRLNHSLLHYKGILERYKDALEMGIGGIRDQLGIKCLHLHVATYLAKLNDPVGLKAMEMLSEKGIAYQCDNMECFKHFERYYMR